MEGSKDNEQGHASPLRHLCLSTLLSLQHLPQQPRPKSISGQPEGQIRPIDMFPLSPLCLENIEPFKYWEILLFKKI